MARSVENSIILLRDNLSDALTACKEKNVTVPTTTKVSGLSVYIDKITSYAKPLIVNLASDFLVETQSLISEPRIIVFTKEDTPTDVKTVDVSLEQDNSVKAWAEDDTLYIGADGNCINTTNCSELFSFEEENKTLELIYFDNFFIEDCTNMSAMFRNCTALKEVDFFNFSTDDVVDMSEMFENCKSLEEIDISNFSTYNVEDMSRMFKGCENLKELNLSTLNTEKVQNAEGMFEDCKNLENLDISSFNFDIETDVEGLFTNCKNLKTIKCENLYKTDDLVEVEEIEIPITNVFKGCKSLEDYSVNKITTQFAIPISDGGYFTDPEQETY